MEGGCWFAFVVRVLIFGVGYAYNTAVEGSYLLYMVFYPPNGYYIPLNRERVAYFVSLGIIGGAGVPLVWLAYELC